MKSLKKSVYLRSKCQGISLIIVLIMLVIIGITASTAMRSATSEQRATNNLRMEATALQYAEAGLRYCEAQMKMADAARVATLKVSVIPFTTHTTSGWEDPLSWTGNTGLASATRTTAPDDVISNADTVKPNKNPECVVESMATYGTVVTARGFSPDYAADGDGKTVSGAVVWLQSISN